MERIQEQIVETGVNRDTTCFVVQEIPEVSVVERIQEQIVETIEVIPQERFQQCTITPTMQVVTREQFHNDVERTPRSSGQSQDSGRTVLYYVRGWYIAMVQYSSLCGCALGLILGGFDIVEETTNAQTCDIMDGMWME